MNISGVFKVSIAIKVNNKDNSMASLQVVLISSIVNIMGVQEVKIIFLLLTSEMSFTCLDGDFLENYYP